MDGFEAVRDIRMELERDEFVVTYDASQATQEKILDVASEAGFPATIVSDPPKDTKSPPPDDPQTEDPQFFTVALAKARRERKYLVIDFSASWCLPCQRLLSETFPDPRVAPLLEQCVFVKVDTDTYPALAKKFSVAGLPDIRFLDTDGKELRRFRDFQDPETFAAALRELLASTTDAPSGS